MQGNTEHIQQTITDILAQREYARSRAPSWDLIDKWVAWLRDLLQHVDGLRVSSPGAYWLIVTGLLALLVLLVWHVAFTIKRAQRPRSVPDDGQERLVIAVETPEMMQQRAEQHVALGDFAEALRWQFSAFLRRYERAHPGVLQPGWTNGECLALCRDRPHWAEPMRRVVNALDYGWYGGRPLQRNEYELLVEDCRVLFGEAA